MAVNDSDQPSQPRNSTSDQEDSTSEPVSPISSSSHNVFDDEFAEDYAESIIAPSITTRQDNQDPFEDPVHTESPSTSSTSLPLSSHPSHRRSHQPDTSEPQSSSLLLPSPRQPQARSQPFQDPRNSIRKSPSGPDSSHYQPLPAIPLQFPSIRNSLAHRSNSTSSLAPHSPIDAEHGPSHPYTMYPQVSGLSRTTSRATATSVPDPALRASPAPQRPAHPYALYPQDIYGDSSDDSAATIPVGFPGHGQQFHRRLGAEGEEQDIIGLDGHSEQLPPYTRYPDAAIIKAPNDFGSSLPIIGEASQSRDAVDEQQQPQSDSLSISQSITQSISSATQVNSADPSFSSAHAPLHSSDTLTESSPMISEKAYRRQTWKEKSRHKLCGFVPVWILLLGITVVVIIAVICGGVIGGYVVKLQDQLKDQSLKTPPPSTVTTALIDAHAITQTTNVPLPTGYWDVQLGEPRTRFPACLSGDQVKAWSCDFPDSRDIVLSIYGTEEKLLMDVIHTKQDRNVSYGSQTPEMSRQQLNLVYDIDNKDFGAAFHFQTFYEKLVVIPYHWIKRVPDAASQSNVFRFRPRSTPEAHLTFDYPPLKPGDRSWFCRWDDTFIEGFIYVSETTVVRSTPSPTSSSYTGSTMPLSFTGVVTVTAVETGPTPEAIGYVVPETAYVTTSTATVTPAPTNAEAWRAESVWRRSDPQSISSRPTESTQGHTTTITTTVTPTPSYMPNLVKFEERRLSGWHGPPVCTRYIYQDDYKFALDPDEQQNPVTIVLDENDGSNWMAKYRYRVRPRSPAQPQYTKGINRANPRYHGDLEDTCYCQWISYMPKRKDLIRPASHGSHASGNGSSSKRSG